jgi:hypothetical protein
MICVNIQTDRSTTSPNAVAAPIYPKGMPVILTTDEERDV